MDLSRTVTVRVSLIDDKLSVDQACGRGLAIAAAQDSPDPGFELGEGERLDDEVIRTEVEGADPVVFGVPSRADDHRHGTVAADLGQHVSAVEAGKSQVKDDKTG